MQVLLEAPLCWKRSNNMLKQCKNAIMVSQKTQVAHDDKHIAIPLMLPCTSISLSYASSDKASDLAGH